MRVLIATSEPWGTYHSRFVMPELIKRGIDASHLVPDLENLAKPGFGRANEGIPVSVGLESILTADLLVVNFLIPDSWPAKAAQIAWANGIPVVFSHLAYLGPKVPKSVNGPFCTITAPSASDALDVANHLGVPLEQVNIVGTPALDQMPYYSPLAKRALIVTSVTGEIGGENLLLKSALTLGQIGWDIHIALHPREDRQLWSKFEISSADTLIAAASAQVVVGIAGSIFPTLAALGVPLVRVVNADLDKAIPASILDLATPIASIEDLEGVVENPAKPTREQIQYLVGPTDGATCRLVDLWVKSVE